MTNACSHRKRRGQPQAEPRQSVGWLGWVIAWTAGAGLALFLVAIPASAQSNSGDDLFLIGSGFLWDSGDSSTCPAVVKSADGSSFEISGVGALNPKGKSVTATGTFDGKSSNGNSLEKTIWISNEFVSLDP